MLRELARARETESELEYKGPGVAGSNALAIIYGLIIVMILWTQIALVYYDPGFVTQDNIEHVIKKFNVEKEGKS